MTETDKQKIVDAANRIAGNLFDSTMSHAVSTWVALEDGRLVAVRLRVFDAEEVIEAIDSAEGK